ncbi:hypothetical protein NW768_007719 [Fusarium equiseti]|uniref:Short chain type dehydrogenase n=1 Tax=Fusarium equiseti TaxID=61235 RepID=A0ABQ8R8A7_FUSEQ|nr:hypothetical protein NW768_007719 [Fusarium equiseti]
MAAKSPVILILGYGANIGKSVANKFSSQGYKVAVAARSVKEDDTDTFLSIPSDFSKTESITNAFDQVKQKFGIPSVVVYNGFLAAGIGKSGAAYMTWTASEAYKNRGFKFYYADERKPDGGPIYRVNEDAHGDMYWELSQGKEQGPWMQSFVKGIGYKAFDTIYER